MWEMVYANHDERDYTERMKVPGGWLYRVTYKEDAIVVTYVPDYAQIMEIINKVTRGAPVFVKNH